MTTNKRLLLDDLLRTYAYCATDDFDRTVGEMISDLKAELDKIAAA